MLMEAKKKGLTTENKMWESIDALSPMLAMMKEEHPEEYGRFMRNQHEMLYGPHYDEHFSHKDVDELEYTDKDGMKHKGAHWTKDEVLAATAGMTFHNSVTPCDKYVAFNSMYSDLCKDFTDEDILKIGYIYFFKDEDAPDGKIWKYMNAMKK